MPWHLFPESEYAVPIIDPDQQKRPEFGKKVKVVMGIKETEKKNLKHNRGKEESNSS